MHMFQIHFVLLISRQGKVRLTKWYSPYTQKERTKVLLTILFIKILALFISKSDLIYMPRDYVVLDLSVNIS